MYSQKIKVNKNEELEKFETTKQYQYKTEKIFNAISNLSENQSNELKHQKFEIELQSRESRLQLDKETTNKATEDFSWENTKNIFEKLDDKLKREMYEII